MKIVQIDGIRGMIVAVIVGACLFSGFVMFPGRVCMLLWNKYLAAAFMFPVLNIFQGILLWGIAVISYAILTRNYIAVSFIETPELNEDEINNILRKARFETKLPLMTKVIKHQSKFDIKQIKNIENEHGYISSPVNSAKEKEEIKDNEKYSNMK